jgi:ribosomal protein S18 acetylase RimI-like enzyme
LRPAALKQLHSTLPGEQQPVLARILSGLDPADEAIWQGLLVAASDEVELSERAAQNFRKTCASARFNAVLWVQRTAGNTAVLWCPPPETEPAKALLRGAADHIDSSDIPLTQMVVADHDGYDDEVQARCGFPKFTCLAYLFAEVPQLPASPPPSATAVEKYGALHFVPWAGEQPQRLEAILEQTYIDTLDCPALEGVRPMNEVLEGYRAQGRYSPEQWYFVQANGRDIGAVILAEHPGFGNWELVYMGIVPDARGRKHGLHIIRYALEAVARRGAERIVLAVDEANAPALRLYEEAGFSMWDRRVVYARLRPRA